ncbi:MAG: PQQ-binding-like beta-propeller repeat protein, partial [Armatimonadetes bacterium]|nr:PQQ-binding-like beta-propeller repeat protein [Armatimonadota bacterium]
RENHATRAAMGFYYGWRHFNKLYRPELSWELDLWRARLQDFWAACFAGFRPFEDSLSQHALGGSMDNTLSIALMEPAWAQDFIQSGRAHLMGERCLAITNNLGQTVLLGDTGVGDYAASVFAKLAYLLNDGRYRFMVEHRGLMVSSTSDEPFRGFDVGLPPVPPRDAVGLQVIPADELYFRSAIRTREDVDMAKAFDKLAMRSGFGRDDEYLMIDGVAGGSHSYDDANSLGEFSANGRRWLCEIDIFNGPTMSFHNAVTVARDGLGDPRVPQAAELIARAQGPDWAYTATRLPKYNGTAWTRHVLWQPRRYTFVVDEMTADESGDYSFVLGWRSLGQPSLQPGLFEAAQDERIHPTIYLDGGKLAASVSASSGKFYCHLAAYNSVLCRSEAPGDFLEVPVTVEKPGDYAVSVETLNYTGRGIMQVLVDGKPLGQPVDMYKDGSPQRRATALGTLNLTAGKHIVRFEVTGRNPASKGAYMAVAGLGLQRAGEAPPKDAGANRFRLVFPASVPATLDRDTEVLGKYLPPSSEHDAALNIVEQSMGRSLQPGQSACFQNAWQARKGAAPDLRLRRLNDHCALIRTGDDIALIGMAAGNAEVQTGPLRASGKMFCLSGERVLLHEAQASLDGKPLAADANPGPGLRQALAQAWEAAGRNAGAAATPPPWQQAPRLRPQWQADLPATPLSVASRSTADGGLVAVGLADGTVRQFAAAGAPAGSFTTGGPVHALLGVDLDGDRSQELLVGSDDTFITALGAKLQPLWKHEVPFRAEVNHWLWWTLDTAKVRRIASGDLDGDGRPELLLGCGNMHVECLDAAGQERWHFRTDHGIGTTITTADVFSDGHQRVLAGNGLTSDSGDCRVFDEHGKLLRSYYNGSWCTALPAIAVGDLDGDGQQTIFCGNNRGDLRAYAPMSKYTESLWIRNLTRPIRSLTVFGNRVIVGSDSGALCAFDQQGEKAWGLPVSSAIVQTAPVRRAGGDTAVAVACKDGKVFIVSPEGKLLALFETPGRTEDLVVDSTAGAGPDRLLLITSGPNRLWSVTP